jgi:hypothetical protein
LQADYLDMLRSNYTGIQYTRFIEGDWGGAEEDMVIPEYHAQREASLLNYDLPEHFFPMTAIDVGSRDFTVALLGHYNFTQGKLYIDNELVIKKNMTTDMLARKLVDLEMDTWGREAKQRWTDVDPRLVEDMNRMHGLRMYQTRKDNKDAQINALRVAIRQNGVIINPRCIELDAQLLGATWARNRGSERTYERTEDHGHFDAVDALIYFYRNLNRSNPYPDPLSGYLGADVVISRGKRKEQEWDLKPPQVKALKWMDTGTGSRSRTAWR